jgi:N-alpha-acetyltransferase 50
MSSTIPGLQILVLDDPRTIEKLRLVDKVCFPVTYYDKYYTALVENGFTKLSNIAIFHDVLIGSITTRLETTEVEGKFRAYIMTLAVLPPYRGMGIATRLLQQTIDYVATRPDVDEVALHVQVGSPALNLYKKNGFEIQEEVPNYYTNIEPTNDALLLRKRIAH